MGVTQSTWDENRVVLVLVLILVWLRLNNL